MLDPIVQLMFIALFWSRVLPFTSIYLSSWKVYL